MDEEYEPMSVDEAEKVADAMAPTGTTDAAGMARYLEALMVLRGESAEAIVVMRKRIFGRQD